MTSRPQPPADVVAALRPFVEVLIRSGNDMVDGGFMNSPAGWYCRMKEPLDFELLRAELSWPDRVEASPDHDTVLDRSTWAAVLGPGAEGY